MTLRYWQICRHPRIRLYTCRRLLSPLLSRASDPVQAFVDQSPDDAPDVGDAVGVLVSGASASAGLATAE